MLRTGSFRIFNSIGMIGLLVLAGVLLTTATAPANDWRDVSDIDHVLHQTDTSHTSHAIVLHGAPLTLSR